MSFPGQSDYHFRVTYDITDLASNKILALPVARIEINTMLMPIRILGERTFLPFEYRFQRYRFAVG